MNCITLSLKNSMLTLAFYPTCVSVFTILLSFRLMVVVYILCSQSTQSAIEYISLINFSSYDNCNRTHPDKNTLCGLREREWAKARAMKRKWQGERENVFCVFNSTSRLYFVTLHLWYGIIQNVWVKCGGGENLIENIHFI